LSLAYKIASLKLVRLRYWVLMADRISERLGHSSIKLTMDTYGHLFEGSDRDSAAKMEKLLGPKHKRSGVQVRVLPKTAS